MMPDMIYIIDVEITNRFILYPNTKGEQIIIETKAGIKPIIGEGLKSERLTCLGNSTDQ
ncbi:hypothetical protein KUV50_06595 [Membranicola marinus]|uniref:Uncharacterized protein n=1 Tax=Membranihabitans marinus TaxID=1227546 RepID=A0A953HT00_9BACT|nr:hypothetical protein [Membranihabitans marinus]MBY5957790.1 hypothetical protein [Membranihabitans marinus]